MAKVPADMFPTVKQTVSRWGTTCFTAGNGWFLLRKLLFPSGEIIVFIRGNRSFSLMKRLLSFMQD
ncbi:hypothetical protein DW966_05355 [Bacteroides stercoris]|nr:hypothetical protein DW966_05355 [Bacteroides stercoris]